MTDASASATAGAAQRISGAPPSATTRARTARTSTLLLPDKVCSLAPSLSPSSLTPYADFRGAAEDDDLIGTSMYVTRIGLERKEYGSNKYSVAKFHRGPVLGTDDYAMAQTVAED